MIENTENTKSTKKSKKYFLLIISLCFVFILFFILYRSFFYKSAEEQLAAIEASRAIPDSENAVVFYNNFFADQNNIAILDELSKRSPASHYLPWNSSKDPESAATLQKHHLTIEKLIDISKIKEARFPIGYQVPENVISTYLRKITFIYSLAGANDIGDGRIDQAIKKFISQVRIGCHLNQQLDITYKIMAMSIESIGLRNIRNLVMHENITKEQLFSLDAIVAETQKYIGQDKELEDKVNRLLTLKQKSKLPFLTRIKEWWTNLRSQNQDQIRWQQTLLRRISTQRAGRIIIALRLYQKQNSKWPDTLNEIKSFLPEENFTDAINNSVFIYKLTGDSFILYSIGPDNIDNNCQKSSDDIIFWSEPNSQVTEKPAPDPNQ